MTCLIFYIFIRYKKPFYSFIIRSTQLKKKIELCGVYMSKNVRSQQNIPIKVRNNNSKQTFTKVFLSFIPDYSEALIVKHVQSKCIQLILFCLILTLTSFKILVSSLLNICFCLFVCFFLTLLLMELVKEQAGCPMPTQVGQ